jgi:hypothetical protein
MKTISNTIRLLLASAALGVLTTNALAGPGLQYWKTLGQEAQIKELKAGDKIAYVCTMCKTISDVPIASKEHAMGLCKEGATVVCPSCKMKSKVVFKRQRNDPPTHTEVTYVNEKGEECAFIAKPDAKK